MELPELREDLDQAQRTKLVHWPTPQEYNEALQVPEQSFGDSTLQSGSAELTALGLPRPITGMFASVYRLRCADGDWAVRCFLHNSPDHHQRYILLHERLARLRLPFTVGFQFQERGIRCQGTWYPILKMQWCEGETLNQWLDRNLARPDLINELAERWKNMIRQLQHHDIAHGDLQHGNVLVRNGELKLVDYDGMYAPEVATYRSNEIGHRHYQHPDRKEEHFGPWLDNFPAWLIYLSMKCIARDPTLWHQLRGGDEFLLVSREDLENPGESAVFYLLEQHHCQEIREYARLLRFLLSLPVEQIPDLDSAPPVPDDLPSVCLREPEILPDWVRNYDEAATAEDEQLYRNWEPPVDEGAVLFRKRKRRRSRAKTGSRAYTSIRSATMNSSGPMSGSGNLAADAWSNASGTCPGQPPSVNPTTGREYPTLLKYTSFGAMSTKWPKWTVCFGLLVLAVCSYVVSIQISANNNHSPAVVDEETAPAIVFPALAFDKRGEANLIAQADRYYQQADPWQALAWYTEAVNVLNGELAKADGDTAKRLHENLARAQKNLGDCYYCTESLEEAVIAYRSSAEEYQLATGNSAARQIADSLSSLALTEFQQGDVDAALVDYRKGVDIFDKYPTLWDDGRKQCMFDYASALRYKGDLSAAEKIEKRIGTFGQRQGPLERMKQQKAVSKNSFDNLFKARSLNKKR